jgi:hypothetical protein
MVILTLIMSLSFFTTINLVSEDAEALGQPIVTVRFHEGESEQIANVRPGEHGTVIFPGTVEARIPAGSNTQDVVVYLSGSTTNTWPVVVNPPTIQVDPGGEAPFQVTVAVPPETSYYVEDQLTITGTATTFPLGLNYNIQGTTGTIRIQQFYKFALSCDKPYREIAPTEQTVFNIKIWNYGNGRDTFNINIPNYNTLVSNGWNIQLERYTIYVMEKTPETVKVTIQSPVKFNHWINEVTQVKVDVVSKQQLELEATSFTETYPLAIRQRGFSLPGFDPIFVIMSFAFITVFLGRSHQLQKTKSKRGSRKRKSSGLAKRKLRK